MNENLTDKHGTPKAYSMINVLLKTEIDINNDEEDFGLVPDFSITANIWEELTVHRSRRRNAPARPLLDKDFEQTYDLLNEYWEESVSENVPEGEIEGWEPEKPLQA